MVVEKFAKANLVKTFSNKEIDMKKQILAVLIAMVIGVSNVSAADQGLQILEQAGAGVLGAVIGYNGAKAAGANQPWSVAGGALGAEVGVSIARAYQQPARRAVYRGQSQPRYSYGGYGSCANQYGNDEELYRECQIGAQKRAADNRREEIRAARDYGSGGYSTSAW